MLNIRGFFGIFIFVSFTSLKNFQVNYNLKTLETAKGCQSRIFSPQKHLKFQLFFFISWNKKKRKKEKNSNGRSRRKAAKGEITRVTFVVIILNLFHMCIILIF